MCEMEGWKENIISDFGEVITGSTPSTKNHFFWENGDYPFYSPADFTDKMFCDVTEKHITKAGLLTGRVIYPNSLMVTCIASIGKMAVNTRLGITNQQINTIAVNSDFDYRFIYYLLLLNTLKIRQIAPQTTVPILNKKNFSNLKFYLPSSINEQSKIANILSTVDNCINQTEQLIDKYKHIKQGLMHDLLTYGIDENGTIRSPQTHTFVEKKGLIMPEEWEVDYIGNIFDVISGATPATEIDEFWNGEINWITPNDLNKVEHVYINQSSRKITEKGLKNCSAQLIPINSIIMSSRAPIGYLAIALVEYTTNQGCKSFVIKNSNRDISEFYVFNLEFNMSKIKDLGTGTTFLEVSKSDLNSILLQFPQDKEEQQRIANIILQQDKLIESEQTNLAKLKNLKQGLMADLLTGKVRVKTESV